MRSLNDFVLKKLNQRRLLVECELLHFMLDVESLTCCQPFGHLGLKNFISAKKLVRVTVVKVFILRSFDFFFANSMNVSQVLQIALHLPLKESLVIKDAVDVVQALLFTHVLHVVVDASEHLPPLVMEFILDSGELTYLELQVA